MKADRPSEPGLHSPCRMLSGENISSRFVVPTVAASVDLIVHLGMAADGVRRVNEIVAVPGRVEHEVIETEPLFVRYADRLVRTRGMPSRMEAFVRAGVDVLGLLRTVD
jgi:pilus assembly protein CpaF